MPEITSRSTLTGAAGMLLAGTLILVIDVRLGSFDVVADLIGGVLVLVAAVRIHGVTRGADTLRAALVGLAVVALPVSVIETFQPATGLFAVLGVSQVLGALVLARLLTDALGLSEPSLASTWANAFQLILWLALVPLLAGMVLSGFTGNVTIESPIGVLVVVILALPLGALLRALWRTAHDPRTTVLEGPSPAT